MRWSFIGSVMRAEGFFYRLRHAGRGITGGRERNEQTSIDYQQSTNSTKSNYYS